MNNVNASKFDHAGFIKLLDSSFESMNEDILSENSRKSRLVFLGEDIFDFTTYDGSISEAMAKDAVEAIDAITERKTFEYFKRDPGNEEKFIRIINTPFFQDRLDWGTSIRGAWWDMTGRFQNNSLDRVHLEDDEKQIDKLTFSTDEAWETFMRAIVEWSKGE